MLSGTFFRDSVLFFFSRQLSILAALVCAEDLTPERNDGEVRQARACVDRSGELNRTSLRCVLMQTTGEF